MKIPLLVASVLLVVSPAIAQSAYPDLKTLLSPAEWKRAGLDRLSPDEIGVIDAALIRYHASLASRHEAEVTEVKQAATAAATTAPAAKLAPGWLERFGLPVLDGNDWRNLPPLKAKVVKWESANRFRLDNGQVWEGFEPITYDLVGKDIEIQARPHDQFALVVNGVNTTLRVMRLR